MRQRKREAVQAVSLILGQGSRRRRARPASTTPYFVQQPLSHPTGAQESRAIRRIPIITCTENALKVDTRQIPASRPAACGYDTSSSGRATAQCLTPYAVLLDTIMPGCLVSLQNVRGNRRKTAHLNSTCLRAGRMKNFLVNLSSSSANGVRNETQIVQLSHPVAIRSVKEFLLDATCCPYKISLH